MFNPLDGPARQFAVSLTSATVVEVKVTTPFPERKVITMQALDADIWVYFGDGSTTPNAATVAANGFKQYRYSKETYECSETQAMFILAVSTTTSVRIAERA